VISVPENSNKFQKTRFWKEKSVEDVITLGPMAQATLVIYVLSSMFSIFKWNHDFCKFFILFMIF
jgi:hypothetical protein